MSGLKQAATSTLRFLALVLIGAAFYLRCWRLFFSWTRLAVALPLLFACGTAVGFRVTLGILAAGAAAGLTWALYRQPTVNAGHRAGAEGFAGALCENTVQSLRALIARDNGAQGPLSDFHYLEFDVHETRDGELVVMHDLASLTEASRASPLNVDFLQRWAETAIPSPSLSVADLSLQDLQKLHVAGREGLHVPTLEEFLGVCQEEGLQRSLAVEVKSIRSDAARSRLLHLLTRYKEMHVERRRPILSTPRGQRGDRSPELYAPFSTVAVIAFPWVWAACFGEFGTATWRHWGRMFREAQIPTRSCCTHCLDFTAGCCGPL